MTPPDESPGAPKQGERPIELYLVGAELAFLLVPFVVVGLAYLFRTDFHTIFYTPYWSVASSILIGQALIRFVSRLLQSRAYDPAISWERVTLIFSVLIVLGLIPSLVVLLLLLISTQPSTYLGVAQLILFIFGVGLFLAFGWTGQEMIFHPHSSEEFSVEMDLTSDNATRSYKKAGNG